MAYPQLQTGSIVNTAYSTSSTNRVFSLSPNIVVGDLLIVVFSGDLNASNTTVLMSTSTGTWQNPKEGGSSSSRFGIWWKFSDGTESSQTMTFSFANGTTSDFSLVTGYIVKGSHFTKPPQFEWTLSLSGVDSPLVSSAWSSDDNLYLSMIAGATGNNATFVSYPTGMSNGTTFSSNWVAFSAQASIQSTATSYDPPTFNYTSPGGRIAAISAAIGPAPSATISSINGGSPIKFGETGIVINIAGYGSTPTSVTATYESGSKTLSFSNIAGNSSSITVDMEDRSEGVDYPKSGDSIRVTVSNGTDSSYIDTTVTRQVGETGQTFVLPVFDDSDYLGFTFSQDGFTTEGGELNYTPYGDLVVNADSGISASNGGTFSSWFRPVTGTGSGNVYAYTWVVSEAGISVVSRSLGKAIPTHKLTGKMLLGRKI